MTRRKWGMLALALAALGVAGWKIQLEQRLEHLREVNVFLQRENARLERETEEVKEFGERLAMLLARNNLRSQVIAGAHLGAEAIAELSRLPRGLVLRSVVVKEGRLTAHGEAPSEADLARVLPALEGSRYLGKMRMAAVEAGGEKSPRRFRLDAEVATPARNLASGAGS